MSEPYRWIAHQQVVERLLRLKSPDRQFLLDAFDRLATDPFQTGDTAFREAQNRDIEVKILGRYVIEFWADHAAKELRIVALDRV